MPRRTSRGARAALRASSARGTASTRIWWSWTAPELVVPLRRRAEHRGERLRHRAGRWGRRLSMTASRSTTTSKRVARAQRRRSRTSAGELSPDAAAAAAARCSSSTGFPADRVARRRSGGDGVDSGGLQAREQRGDVTHHHSLTHALGPHERGRSDLCRRANALEACRGMPPSAPGEGVGEVWSAPSEKPTTPTTFTSVVGSTRSPATHRRRPRHETIDKTRFRPWAVPHRPTSSPVAPRVDVDARDGASEPPRSQQARRRR